MVDRIRYNELFGAPRRVKNRTIVFLPDGCEKIVFDHFLNSQFQTIKDSYINKEAREKLIEELYEGVKQDRISSSIDFRKSKETDYYIFSYPRFHFADYASIFQAIFSIKDYDDLRISKNRSCKDGDEVENHLLFKKISSDENGFHAINLEDFRHEDRDRAYYIAYYLLDFILGLLASDCMDYHESSEEVPITPSLVNDFRKSIKRLSDEIDYCPTELVKESAVKRLEDSKHLTDLKRNMISIFISIAKGSCKSKLFVPDYSIYLPRMWELYLYAVLKKVYPKLLFKEALEHGFGTPDMMLEDMSIILDAKYKPSYFEPSFVERGDCDRINKYLCYNKKADSVRVGLIVYPDMSRGSIGDEVSNGIKLCKERKLKKAKVGCRIPIKESPNG